MISLGRITSVAAVSSSEFCSSKVVQFFDAAASAVALMNWLNASKMSLEASRIAIKRNEKITLKMKLKLASPVRGVAEATGAIFWYAT